MEYHWEHTKREASVVGSGPPLCVHVSSRALMVVWVPSPEHPWVHILLRPFSLSLHSQPQSSPQVCPLKPEFKHPASHPSEAPTKLQQTLILG